MQDLNRVLYAKDNLDILKDDKALPSDSIDLIYLDPPFNSQSKYNLPFKGDYRTKKPAEAFKDTWEWGENEEILLAELESSAQMQAIVELVKSIKRMEVRRTKYSTAAYLVNMTIRLEAMKRVLKDTGSIYLHCDPTASYYLRIVMDIVFGKENFLNEIIWHYTGGGRSKTYFSRKHDVLLYYAKKAGKHTFNVDAIRVPYKETSGYAKGGIVAKSGKRYTPHPDGTPVDDVWGIPIINPLSKERIGYPTQKPLELLDRIIQASSNEGDLVLDPFCGCGTAVHSAERFNRRWIGIDISAFSTELIKNRVCSASELNLSEKDVSIHNVPTTVDEARTLARENPHEFEKWVCGYLGAEGLYHNPGDKGADGGIDGVLRIIPSVLGEVAVVKYAIIQVKGGNVSPDAVRALYSVVDNEEETIAGVMVCFEDQMRTVENNRSKKTFKDDVGSYPVIQGLSIEDMLDGKRLRLPNQ